ESTATGECLQSGVPPESGDLHDPLSRAHGSRRRIRTRCRDDLILDDVPVRCGDQALRKAAATPARARLDQVGAEDELVGDSRRDRSARAGAAGPGGARGLVEWTRGVQTAVF